MSFVFLQGSENFEMYHRALWGLLGRVYSCIFFWKRSSENSPNVQKLLLFTHNLTFLYVIAGEPYYSDFIQTV